MDATATTRATWFNLTKAVKPRLGLLGTLHGKLLLVLLLLLAPVVSFIAITAIAMYPMGDAKGAYISHLTVWGALIGLVFTLVAGFVLFYLLTLRLRKLTEAIEALEQSEFGAALSLPNIRSPLGEDEIDRLAKVFAQMQQHIETQVQAIRQADTNRRELFANVSHDLRTPLASLRGYVETLLMKDEQLTPEERRRFLNTALRQGEHLSRMVTDLFDLAKLEARPTLHLERFRICELVYDVTEKYRLLAQERGLSLEVTQDHNVLVEGDIGLIERVLTNLLDNAMRHTPSGGRVMLGLIEEDDQATVRVTDTGQGIATEDLSRIFDRFYRVEKNRPKDLGSTGLGLAITKLILELHKAQIVVESMLGRGTSFTFSLPICGKEKSNCAPNWK